MPKSPSTEIFTGGTSASRNSHCSRFTGSPLAPSLNVITIASLSSSGSAGSALLVNLRETPAAVIAFKLKCAGADHPIGRLPGALQRRCVGAKNPASHRLLAGGQPGILIEPARQLLLELGLIDTPRLGRIQLPADDHGKLGKGCNLLGVVRLHGALERSPERAKRTGRAILRKRSTQAARNHQHGNAQPDAAHGGCSVMPGGTRQHMRWNESSQIR